MSYNDGFSVKPIPFVQPIAGTASMLISSPDGTRWIPSGIVDNAISASVYVIETIETEGNIDGNGAPEDKVRLRNNISLNSVTASFKGDGNQITNITASNITNFSKDVRLQLSGTKYIEYNEVNGVLIVPYTGTILGTTPLILGESTTVLNGLDSINSAQITGSGANITDLTASNITNFTTDVRSQITAGNGIDFTSGIITADVAQVVAGANMVIENNSGTVTASLSASVVGLNKIESAQGEITSLTSSNTFISGDLRVNGTASFSVVNTINQQSLVVGDKYITILSGGVDHPTLDGSGILWGSGSSGPTVNELGSNAHIRFRNAPDALEIFPNLIVSGTISGGIGNFTSITSSFSGNGVNIANITASNISNFTNDVRAQITAGQNISITSGNIAFSGVLPVVNGGTGLSSSGVAGNILVSDGTNLASRTMNQDVSLASNGFATVKGLYTNPVRSPAVTAPTPGDFLKWGGTDWFPAPVSATVLVGSLQLTSDPAQTVTANGQTILPTSAYWRINTAGNYNAGNINYIGAGLGSILFIQVPLGQAGSITFNKGPTLALGSNTRKINAGGSLQLIYDGTHWIEMFFNTSTSL